LARQRAGIARTHERALRQQGAVKPVGSEAPSPRKRKYDAAIKDALAALSKASDRVCGKRW